MDKKIWLANPFRRTRILLACMPKSGSTYLSGVIAKLPGFRQASLVPKYGAREPEIDMLKLSQNLLGHYVAQHHVRNHEWTQKLCERFELKPVVLTRNLFDVIPSLRDHIRRESTVWFHFYVPPGDVEKSDAELEVKIAELAIPWYLNFYFTWREAPGAMVIDFNDMVEDQIGLIDRVMTFAGHPVDRAAIEKAIGATNAKEKRLNVGRPGRGADIAPEAKEAVRRLIRLYDGAEADPYLAQHL